MNCTYVLKTVAKKLKSEPTKVWYFFCHHSGHYISKGKGTKLFRNTNLCCMESCCPSSLTLNETNSKFYSSLYLPHIGRSTSETAEVQVTTGNKEMGDTAVPGATLSNVEIKAKVHDLELLLQKARSMTDQQEQILVQQDTYFKVPAGRLKLREIEGQESQLVFYERPDTEGPKLSRYKKQNFENAKEAAGLKVVLQASLGTVGIVKKKRYLLMSGQTRIHVDEVENLGNFMELEVVMRNGQSVAEGQAVADEVMSALNICSKDLLPCSYIDLLLQKST